MTIGASTQRCGTEPFASAREPAVELHVPAEVADERSTAFVDQLGPAVALTEPTRSCV